MATHSETGEKLVIYQALYGDYQVYARPLAMFVSEVDREKNIRMRRRPTVLNAWTGANLRGAGSGRMERAEAREAGTGDGIVCGRGAGDGGRRATDQIRVSQMEQSLSDEVNPKLMQFLTLIRWREKYNILVSMRDEVDDHLINSMAVVLDVVIPEGPVADRYEQLKACIRTKQRYETQRMR